jgi:hypothetical protein
MTDLATKIQIMQAALDGKEIERFVGDTSGWVVLVNPKEADYDWRDHDYRIKPVPIKWYENIPSGGVLCWVGDSEKRNTWPEFVINYCDDSTHFFETPNESWVYAEPLTKQEIQVFFDNVPEV